MVKSMTGYGRAREMRNGRDITVEVRSVNNRYLDCTVKMPRAYIFAGARWTCSSPSMPAPPTRRWWR